MAGYYENPDATAEVLREGWLHTGDLGRIDSEGRLSIVGRKKDVIIDANGKNVYPDELEELYGDSLWIKELSVVGLPDEDGGETIACLAVPNYEHDQATAREKVRAHVQAHLRDVSAGLPFFKRVKVVHLWDGELPRTATRKVKRKLVQKELERLERATRVATQARRASPDADGAGWLTDVIAQVAGKPRELVHLDARFSDLGYDSLMYTELGVALEAAGANLPEDIAGIQTVRDLARLVKRRGAALEGRSRRAQKPEPEARRELAEIELPDSVQALGRRLVRLGHQVAYRSIMRTRVYGSANIPAHGRFLVAANHQSHLDMGLVKHALGDHGKNLIALAAKDYFFDSWRGFYFKNFTNLLPMERQRSLKESLRLASEVIASGLILLIFPEGTRSPSGQMAEFKASLGYLALTNQVDVLPMYLEGTHDAMPKGALLPTKRDIAARIGPVITYELLKQRTEKLSRSEAYRTASAVVEEAVVCLRDRRRFELPPLAGAATGTGTGTATGAGTATATATGAGAGTTATPGTKMIAKSDR